MSQNLQEEKLQVKKQNSYTYWVDEKNKSKVLPPEQQPKKIEVPIQLEKKQSNPSPWNTMGTWEQRSVSMAQLKSKIENEVTKWLEASEETEHRMCDVSFEGDLQIIFKRGKKNLMYEIKGSVEFENQKQQKKGKLKIEQLTDQGDKEYKIKGDAIVREWVKKHSNELMKIVEKEIAKYKQ